MAKVQEIIEKKQQQTLLQVKIKDTSKALEGVLTDFIAGNYSNFEKNIAEIGYGIYEISSIIGLDFDDVMQKYLEIENTVADLDKDNNECSSLDSKVEQVENTDEIVIFGKRYASEQDVLDKFKIKEKNYWVNNEDVWHYEVRVILFGDATVVYTEFEDYMKTHTTEVEQRVGKVYYNGKEYNLFGKWFHRTEILRGIGVKSFTVTTLYSDIKQYLLSRSRGVYNRNAVPAKIDGIKFESKIMALVAYNVSYSAYKRSIDKGQSIEQICIDRGTNVRLTKEKFDEVNKEEASNISSKIDKEVTSEEKEEASNISSKIDKKVTNIEKDSSGFKTDSEAARACNVSPSSFCMTKKKYGYTRKETVEHYRKKGNIGKDVIIKTEPITDKTDDKEKFDQDDIVDSEKIDILKKASDIVITGEEKEVVAPVQPKEFEGFSVKALIEGPCIIKGVYYPTLDRACLRYNQDVDLAKQRVNNGWSVLDAVIIKKGGHRPKHKKRRNKNDTKPVSSEGVWFRDLYEASLAYNMAYNTVITRVFNQNWCYTDALKTPLTYHKTHIHTSTAISI